MLSEWSGELCSGSGSGELCSLSGSRELCSVSGLESCAPGVGRNEAANSLDLKRLQG